MSKEYLNSTPCLLKSWFSIQTFLFLFKIIISFTVRSSHQRCSMRKGALRNFAKFTGKHLCKSLFLNKVAGLVLQLYLKKRLWHVFSCEFCEISKSTFSYRTPPVAASVSTLNNLFIASLVDRFKKCLGKVFPSSWSSLSALGTTCLGITFLLTLCW